MEIKGHKLDEIAGDGRTGRVYRAKRQADGAIVAFRQVKPRLAKEDGVGDAVAALARDCADLRNVVIVPVIDSFVIEGAICVVEPWVEGTTLKERVRQGTMPPEDIVTLGVELAEALEELHEAGLIHGDVSPANVMLTSRGARLTGFGVAARTGRRRADRSMFGDPYDAPELQTSGTPTVSTDLFGLAASLNTALLGEQEPGGGFQLESPEDEEDPLKAVLKEGMASHPGMRFKSAAAFKRALLGVAIGTSPAQLDAQRRKKQAPDDWEDIPSPRDVASAPREMPAWAPKAAIGAVAGGLLVAGIMFLVSLLPDVPEGMVEVPASGALMGDEGGAKDEGPGFTWNHPRFFLDRFEVTRGEYETCISEGGCTSIRDRLDRPQDEPMEPVVGATWLQATAFCAWADKRLPSENEWEAAARHFGGRYPSGNQEPHCGLAWFGAWSSGPCGTPGNVPAPRRLFLDEGDPKRPVHMAGNVWEFTNSDYEPHRGGNTGGLAPAGSSVLKVIKGGAFSTGMSELRSAARLGVEMDHWAADVGFRCALTPERP